MKLSAALILAPFVLLASAAPNPNTDGLVIKEKIAAVGAREVSPVDLHARAPVTGTVNTDGVRYRRCERTSCEAVGQYNNGQSITINCRVRGETVNGWPWWDRLSNDYYISDAYVTWSGGVPDDC